MKKIISLISLIPSHYDNIFSINFHKRCFLLYHCIPWGRKMCLTLISFALMIVTRMIGKVQTIHLIDFGNLCSLFTVSMVDLRFHCKVKIYRKIGICWMLLLCINFCVLYRIALTCYKYMALCWYEWKKAVYVNVYNKHVCMIYCKLYLAVLPFVHIWLVVSDVKVVACCIWKLCYILSPLIWYQSGSHMRSFHDKRVQSQNNHCGIWSEQSSAGVGFS